ncbi:MAG TPA: chemotaxis response regulator protein-glutamate methylesterase [Thermoanaerobaculia bacterium]|nr:chemotaxis response regulator protein-glutamate methylesterase [Thermoanaerobaculia bacterium]
MPIRLAVVDDSTFVRKAIRRMLAGDARFEVVGSAISGEELLANLERWQPDVITLDLSMPGIGGLVTLDRIMTLRPTPVIILSTHAGRGAPQTIEALHRGAADFIDKQQYSLLDFDALGEVLAAKIAAVARGGTTEAPVIRARRPGVASVAPAPTGGYQILLIGASTGGPPAIEQVLADLGATCPVPVLVVQHMPKGFTSAFADRLNGHLPLAVREGQDGAALRPGTVYIGPAGNHLRVLRRGEQLVASLSARPEAALHRPSVDELFRSAARTVEGGAVSVLLTGMGRDGAEGMLELARAGAFTIAQDEPTSVVYGMPGAAVALQAVREVLPLARIGPRLCELLAPTAAGSRP